MITTKSITKIIASTAVSTVILLGAAQAWASGSHDDGHGSKAKVSVGKKGMMKHVSRTIEIKMFDNYYEPENISVRAGETVKFVIKNVGDFVHEFNIGTSEMHTAHQAEMVMMMQHGALEVDKINHDKMNMDMGNGKSMKHDDPNSVLLEPGKSGEVIWKFSKPGAIEFACNVPGHYDAGMMGKVKFDGKPAS